MLGLDRDSLFLGKDFDLKKLGYNYDKIIKDLVVNDIKGKKVGFSFYRKLLLGGYYFKMFEYGDNKELCLYDVISLVILNNDLKYLDIEKFKDELLKCLLRFINENIIIIDNIELFIENFISDIKLSYNNEMNRVSKIKKIIGDSFDKEKWRDMLILKDRFDENRGLYSREILVGNLGKWGIVSKDDMWKLNSINKNIYFGNKGYKVMLSDVVNKICLEIGSISKNISVKEKYRIVSSKYSFEDEFDDMVREEVYKKLKFKEEE